MNERADHREDNASDGKRANKRKDRHHEHRDGREDVFFVKRGLELFLNRLQEKRTPEQQRKSEDERNQEVNKIGAAAQSEYGDELEHEAEEKADREANNAHCRRERRTARLVESLFHQSFTCSACEAAAAD